MQTVYSVYLEKTFKKVQKRIEFCYVLNELKINML